MCQYAEQTDVFGAFIIVANTDDLANERQLQELGIQDVIVHPDYQPGDAYNTPLNDLALIKLNAPWKGKTISLFAGHNASPHRGFVTGFGSTGEFAGMTAAERLTVLEATRQAAGNDCFLFANVSACAVGDVLELARQAAEAEHEAVLRRSRDELDEARAATARAEEAAAAAEASRASVEALRDEERTESDGVRGERDSLQTECDELRSQIERERQQARDAAEARACEAADETDATIAELRRQLEVEREVAREAESERDALAKKADEAAAQTQAAHASIVKAKDERIARLEKVKMTTAIFAQIQKLRTDKERALAEAKELRTRVAALEAASASPKEAREDTELAERCAAADAACKAATERAARLEARAARAEQSMSKIRTPGGRRALRETDALHDKIEFLEQENLDLMLEVKALKASQARLAASPVAAVSGDVGDENAPPGPSPVASKLSAVKASPGVEAQQPAEGTQECTQS